MGSAGRKGTDSGITQTAPLDRISDAVYRRTAEKLLALGNTAEFARVLLQVHPDFAKAQNFTEDMAINSYGAHIDYNEGIFTFYGEDSEGLPTKYFFDTKMNLRGAKQ